MRTSEPSSKVLRAADIPPAAELEHVCFNYGPERVLDEVSLRVDRGDILGLIGPNGSGKTTLLRVLLGLLRPTCGHVRLFGTEVAAFRQWERVGYVPQKAAFNSLFPAAVSEVVISGRWGRVGVGRRFTGADREAARRTLDLVGLSALGGRRVAELSSGQQQRVLIARALVSGPELLLLDEPTVGVDVDAQEQFYSLLRRLNHEEGVTLILVSHDIGFVTREVSRLACLNRTLVFHGSPEEAVASGALAEMYRTDAWMVAHRH